MKPLGLTAPEKADVVAFMHALTGEMALEGLAPPLPEEAGTTPAPGRRPTSEEVLGSRGP